MANNKITTTALDFDTIKSSLKSYLQGQSQFTDYDFDGSGLSILLDVLAYNTHYNALYTNLAVNEAFLDSASKRASVVSRSKELGYVPYSSTAATATVTVVITVPSSYGSNVLSLAPQSLFSTSVEGTPFSFFNLDTILAYRNGNTFTYENVIIKEGTYLNYQYTASPNATYIIPNTNVDLSTVRVNVQANAQTSVYETFIRSEDLINLSPTAPAYFIKELSDMTYEIQFGDDLFGKSVAVGSLINIDYLVCNATLPNGASRFTYAGSLPSGASANVITSVKAIGGTFPETIDSIKWNAPRYFAAQNRCVTAEDYKTVIRSRYPNIQSINVWGGEQNIPPSYGDVFVSIKPISGTALSASEKDLILKDIIGPRQIMTVHPKMVDPTYLDVEMAVSFYYDANRTTRSATDIIGLVRQSIMNYNDTTLSQFEGIMRMSQLTRVIDSSEQSIVNSIVTFRVHRHIDVVYNQATNYIVYLANPVYNSGTSEESILSSGFSVLNINQTCYIDDLPTEGTPVGVLRLFYFLNSKKTVLKNVGTIDYDTGLITIKDVIITNVEGDALILFIKTQSDDITSSRNQIVSIDETKLTITPITNTSSDTYKFASGRN